MPILIDGYNLLNLANIVVEEAGKYTLEKSRRAVLRYVMAIVPSSELAKTTVVFDGREAPPGLPASGKFGPIQVRFSKRGTEADDLIEALLPTYSTPKSLVVVSSDHRVQRAARRRGARGVDSEIWASEMIARRRSSRKRKNDKSADPGSATKVKLTATEVADWLKEFSDIDVHAIELEVSSEAHFLDSNGATPHSSDTSEVVDLPEDADEPTGESDESELMGDGLPFNPFPPGYGEDLL